ncbi:MAG: hypothetical protein ACNA7O_06535 [Rhodobacterales bacterium]
MEAIIHPGMHKTGSSSIQATAVSIKPDGWIFPDNKTGNFSGRFALLFEDNPEDYHAFKARGMNADAVEVDRQKRLVQLENQLRKGSAEGLNALFSAERISTSPLDSIQRLADLYRKHGYEPRVVAYVRRPISFMQSAFQQRLKLTLNDLKTNAMLWPNYRKRFEKLDQVFGRENVKLNVFDRSTLKQGDVCIDFFGQIGIDLSVEQVVRVNESLSLPACALLFAQRHLGEGFVQGFKRAPAKNNAFIAALSRLPGDPLKFKRSYVAPIFEEWRKDLEWMEERLGQSLSDLPDEDSDDAIGSAEDLLAVADRHRHELEELLFEEIRKEGDQPRDRLIRNLELLRKLHY